MLLKLIRVLSRSILAPLKYCAHRQTGRRLGKQAGQLRGMNELELKDLGIGRGEIPSVLQTEAPQCADDRWGNRHPM